MPRKVFVAGEILTASDVNTNLMDQSVMVFDDATARTTAIPTPVEGMVTYLSDVNQVQAFTGAAFTPVGTILQVVSTTKTDTFATSSATFTDITGLTASITPSSASSKIFIVADLNLGGSFGGVNQAIYARLSGGNSTNYVGDAAGSKVRTSWFLNSTFATSLNAYAAPAQISFLDSPATASAVTYSAQLRVAAALNLFVNRAAEELDTDRFGRTASSITLMEVAG